MNKLIGAMCNTYARNLPPRGKVLGKFHDKLRINEVDQVFDVYERRPASIPLSGEKVQSHPLALSYLVFYPQSITCTLSFSGNSIPMNSLRALLRFSARISIPWHQVVVLLEWEGDVLGPDVIVLVGFDTALLKSGHDEVLLRVRVHLPPTKLKCAPVICGVFLQELYSQ